MARSFLQYPTAPYNGAYSSKAFNAGRGDKIGELVPVDLLWGSYTVNGQPLGSANPNFSVSVNLNTAGPQTVGGTWTPRSVYIDNEGVDFPVYVFFPDTQFTVSAPANSAGWYQVYTLGKQALVTALGIDNRAITLAQRTRVFFTDVLMVPSLDEEIQSTQDLWLASLEIASQSIATAGFGPPALGDQVTSIAGFSIDGASHNIPNMSNFPGFNIYITQYQITAVGIKGNFTGSISLSNGSLVDTLAIENDGVVTLSGILRDIRGNLKFDGAATWAILAGLSAGSTPAGLMNVDIVFTISPK